MRARHEISLLAKQTNLKRRPTFHTRPVDTFSARKNTPQHRWEKRQAPRQGTQPKHKTTGATRAPQVSPTAPPAVRTSSALAHLWDTKKTRFPGVRSLVERLVGLTIAATATRTQHVCHTNSTCKRRQELTVACAAPRNTWPEGPESHQDACQSNRIFPLMPT